MTTNSTALLPKLLVINKNNRITKLLGVAIALVVFPTACSSLKPNSEQYINIDKTLHSALIKQQITPQTIPHLMPEKILLGKMLFFDKILSGNNNISCATCHLPEAASSDALPLSIGEGGNGRASNRKPPANDNGTPFFTPRNSLDIFNRGQFSTFFWDGRVSSGANGEHLTSTALELVQAVKFATPAGFLLPDGLDNALAAQAMFPPTSDVEMRGNVHENTLADLHDWKFDKIWSKLMVRLLEINEYRHLFNKAYPETSIDKLSFVHAANAIAVFEIAHFTFNDAPFDRYISGDNAALSVNQKKGALLFYGKAGCGRCHSGSLMTDQLFHNRVVPQIGPGKGDLPGGGNNGLWDAGRGGATGRTKDYYCFRTPPLRNVSRTGPWMHDGVFSTLEAAVRHELNPLQSARNYAPARHLPDIYAETCRLDQTETIVSLVDTMEIKPVTINDSEFSDLMTFLNALTSPQLDNLNTLPPLKVPSSLPVAD